MGRQFNTNKRVKSGSDQPSLFGKDDWQIRDLSKLTLVSPNDTHPQTYISAKIDGCAVRFVFIPPELVEISIHTDTNSKLTLETDAKVVNAVQEYIKSNHLYLGFGIPPTFEGVGFITRIKSEGQEK